MQSVEEFVVMFPRSRCTYWMDVEESVDELEASVKEVGIITPLFGREKNGYIQVYIGLNRLRVADKLKIEFLPIIIRNLDDTEITILRIEDNLARKDIREVKPSKLADLIYDYHKAIKSQGKRTDLLKEVKSLMDCLENEYRETFCPVGEKLNSCKQTGSMFGLSSRTISRFLRIKQLKASLKHILDEGHISIRAAVELSYLKNEEQEMVAKLIVAEGIELSEEVCARLRKVRESYPLDEEVIREESGVCCKHLYGFTRMRSLFYKYELFNYTKEELEDILDKALEMYLSSAM